MNRYDETPVLPFELPDPLTASMGLRELWRSRPVARVLTPAGDPAWLVTGYHEVRALLSSNRLFLSHPCPEAAARVSDSVFFGGPTGSHETEHADRSCRRARLQPFFSPRRMRALRPRVTALAEELIGAIVGDGPPADLHAVLSVPLPLLVICELLGVPYRDRARFRGWIRGFAHTSGRRASADAYAELIGYMHELTRRKRVIPDDGVVSGLCAVEDDDGEVAMQSAILLFAGHETTVVQMDLGILLMLSNPGQRQALLDHPDMLGPAVEEMLRAGTVGGLGIPRYAGDDIDIGGVTVRAGDLLLLHLGAANHDERVFADASRFLITRPSVSHVMFGYGRNYCLGAPLARLELQEVFARLFHRLPGLRLSVPYAEMSARCDPVTCGISELPVTW